VAHQQNGIQDGGGFDSFFIVATMHSHTDSHFDQQWNFSDELPLEIFLFHRNKLY
jgi:hypothetical protein